MSRILISYVNIDLICVQIFDDFKDKCHNQLFKNLAEGGKLDFFVILYSYSLMSLILPQNFWLFKANTFTSYFQIISNTHSDTTCRSCEIFLFYSWFFVWLFAISIPMTIPISVQVPVSVPLTVTMTITLSLTMTMTIQHLLNISRKIRMWLPIFLISKFIFIFRTKYYVFINLFEALILMKFSELSENFKSKTFFSTGNWRRLGLELVHSCWNTIHREETYSSRWITSPMNMEWGES